jgi:hypothetical protein
MADESSSPLLNYVTRLHEDETLRAEFERDPHAAIDAADLSPEAKAALKSRDLKQVHAHIVQESGGEAPADMAMVFWFFGGTSA